MMPTFDFLNVLKRIFTVRFGLYSFFSPVKCFVALSVALGVILSSVLRFFDVLQIPEIASTIDFQLANSELKSFFYYITAADEFLSVINFVISFISLLIPFVVGFISSLSVALFVWRMSASFRAWVLQYMR